MKGRIGRVALIAGLVFGALTLFSATADAHTYVEWGGDGCLHYLHRSDIGSLNWNTITCDGRDNYWAGRVRDDHATSDGYCVRAELDGILMASSCNSSGTSFTFLDPQRNSNAVTCITESNGSFRCASNVDF